MFWNFNMSPACLKNNKLMNFNLEFLGTSGNDSETSDGYRVEVGHGVVVAEPARVTGPRRHEDRHEDPLIEGVGG